MMIVDSGLLFLGHPVCSKLQTTQEAMARKPSIYAKKLTLGSL